MVKDTYLIGISNSGASPKQSWLSENCGIGLSADNNMASLPVPFKHFQWCKSYNRTLLYTMRQNWEEMQRHFMLS